MPKLAQKQNHCNFTVEEHIINAEVMDLNDILGICNAIHFEFESRLLDHQKQLEEAKMENKSARIQSTKHLKDKSADL